MIPMLMGLEQAERQPHRFTTLLLCLDTGAATHAATMPTSPDFPRSISTTLLL